MFLIPLRPCKCNSFHKFHVRCIEFNSRENLRPRPQVYIGWIHLQHTQPAQLAGLARGFNPRFAWQFRVAVMKLPRTQESHQLRRLQHTRIAVSIYLLFLGLKATDENSTGKCGSYPCMLQMNPPVIKRLVVVIFFYIRLKTKTQLLKTL